MAMQIQRGLVKYKDRSDIICTYGVSPTGVQYYFLDEARLANENIIVTTTLLEAVDPVALATHVGVIDPDGNVVIQCVNKSIKPISNEILLVEKAQPTSQNVLDSISLRDDPNAATRLVTTPATIKDNINKVMDSNGRFVFNDQFSEASIYDINGNNLVNDELYSFIGMDDNKIYLSKNTIDSEVVALSINENGNQEDTQPKLNVETTDIEQGIIEKALNENETDEYVEEDNTTEVSELDENSENVESNSEETSEEKFTYEETETPVEENTVEEYSEDVNVPDVEENVYTEYSEEDNTTDSVIPDIEETSEEKLTLNLGDTYEEEVSTKDNVEDNNSEEPVEEEVKEKEENSTEEVYEELENPSDAEQSDVEESQEELPEIDEEDENPSSEDNETDGGVTNDIDYQENYEEEEFDNPVYVEDSYDYGYDSDDSYNNLVESYNYSNSSTIPQKNIFDDVTVTISNLVELNRNLQSMVDSYEIKLSKCDASRKKLVELSKSQAREISSLNARIARLEADKEVLEAKVNALTPSANGDLVRVMADAHNILGQTQRTLRRKNNY